MKFTIPPNKDYKVDIEILKKEIESENNFSFSKFCDGEWSVINNDKINNKEFWFNPSDIVDQKLRQLLINAFKFDYDRYYIGITCVKVFGLDVHKKMTEISGRTQDKITWADIWVNSNYHYYLNNIVPLFQRRPIVLFCQEAGKIENLPFVPKKVYRISNNAWKNNFNLIDESKEYIDKNNIRDHIFLFCCGPFGNILCHQLTDHNQNNTYLDIGSTLNPWLKSAGFDRDYYLGNNFFSNLVGEWDQ